MAIAAIKKILVANRGEIAVRVINACRELGITSVAVYSDADRRALHVLSADEAVAIGAAPPLESYLNVERIIAAALERGCDAIHPGYGFLSENPAFVSACIAAGLVFIGPSSEAMEAVGDKLTARQTMIDAGVPVTPGVAIEGESADWIQEQADAIGFPVMIKASAGGGGKGMRIVHTADALTAAIAASRREASSAFGNDTVYMEKYIRKPRHIEFQVLADRHGNTVHLFERECSIQRRHQKIIEETPSPVMDSKLRKQMGETACRVVKAVGYENAGTVEFLLDEHKKFYFLEVNARIQVEHPVTEMVTGVDLVKQQIRIAAGEALGLAQEDLRQQGHAIECRIYAEDPENNFFPSVGKLHYFQAPQSPGVRMDSGVYSGVDISHFYDPILAKLVVHGVDRADAIQKMQRALSDTVVLGVKTGIPFMKDVLHHPNFVSGNIDTGFIQQHLSSWQPTFSESKLRIAMVAAAHAAKPVTRQGVGRLRERSTPWQSIGDWELLATR